MLKSLRYFVHKIVWYMMQNNNTKYVNLSSILKYNWFQRLAGGLFNNTYKISEASSPDDEMVLKIFTEESSFLIDHAVEYKFLKLLTEKNCMVQIHCK